MKQVGGGGWSAGVAVCWADPWPAVTRGEGGEGPAHCPITLSGEPVWRRTGAKWAGKVESRDVSARSRRRFDLERWKGRKLSEGL